VSRHCLEVMPRNLALRAAPNCIHKDGNFPTRCHLLPRLGQAIDRRMSEP
jgi:hypothetical protein